MIQSLRSLRMLGFAAALAAATLDARAQARLDEEDGAAPLPAAPDILARVRAAFPRQPLLLSGELITRAGREDRTVLADVLLEWGAEPPQGRFVIRDAFGRLLEQLTVRRPAGGAAAYDYARGDPPADAPVPDLRAAVADTEFSWADLSLGFLWWPGGKTYATEMKKGRECYVVDLPAPGAGEAYARLRLWIDTEAYALLQADAFDARGDLVKRLAVKSLKKVEGRWTLKDFDVQSFPSRRRTTFSVDRVELIGADGRPVELAAGADDVTPVHPEPVAGAPADPPDTAPEPERAP